MGRATRQWPAVIVQHLRKKLPDGYVAEPRVHSGSQVEIDVAAFEKDDAPPLFGMTEGNGGVATAVWAPAQPSVAVETTLPDYDEYEVRIFDARRGRHLVAAIEIVSPANKDRPEHRNVFVGKCAASSGSSSSMSRDGSGRRVMRPRAIIFRCSEADARDGQALHPHTGPAPRPGLSSSSDTGGTVRSIFGNVWPVWRHHRSPSAYGILPGAESQSRPVIW